MIVKSSAPDALVREINASRADLLRIARFQLRDADLAEDVVQETLLAAMKSRARFAGRAKLMTWLIGILKFKVLDALRRSRRDPIPLSDLVPELETADLDGLFDEGGTWRDKPVPWPDPHASVQQHDFLRVLEMCLTRLPPNSARVFMLREIFGLESREICRVMSLTRSNLGVLLFRARLSLRQCLDSKWFAPAQESST